MILRHNMADRSGAYYGMSEGGALAADTLLQRLYYDIGRLYYELMLLSRTRWLGRGWRLALYVHLQLSRGPPGVCTGSLRDVAFDDAAVSHGARR